MAKRKWRNPDYKPPKAEKMKAPYKGRWYQCEGYDEHDRFEWAHGDTAELAERNWRYKQCKHHAIVKLQNEEAQIYKHNRKKYDR